ncbi:hypothetical protein BC332_20269 [Capsicum chinense]|nr:hypothetical protein BC332_20269 [Capsicum chinense]
MATSACGNSNESSSSLATLAPLQAVLFDIDGTLCDSDPFHYLAFREMLLEIGYNGGVPVDEEWFVKIISGKHNDDLVAVLFPDDHERGVNSWMTRKFCLEDPFHYLAFREMLLEIGYNGGVPVDEEWFVKIISGKHNDDLVAVLFPDDHERGVNSWMTRKFCLEGLRLGIKAGVAAGMSVVGLANRNPSHLLMEAEPVFLIKDYEDPKLWAALDAIDKMSGTGKTTA